MQHQQRPNTPRSLRECGELRTQREHVPGLPSHCSSWPSSAVHNGATTATRAAWSTRGAHPMHAGARLLLAATAWTSLPTKGRERSYGAARLGHCVGCAGGVSLLVSCITCAHCTPSHGNQAQQTMRLPRPIPAAHTVTARERTAACTHSWLCANTAAPFIHRAAGLPSVSTFRLGCVKPARLAQLRTCSSSHAHIRLSAAVTGIHASLSLPSHSRTGASAVVAPHRPAYCLAQPAAVPFLPLFQLPFLPSHHATASSRHRILTPALATPSQIAQSLPGRFA